MEYTLRDEALIGWWENFFLEYCKSDIETVALEYPQKRSLLVDYWKIDRVDHEMADLLLSDPQRVIANAEEALNSIDVAVDKKMKLHFRVYNLPETQHIAIRNLRAEHLGKLVAVEGLVKKVTEVRPKLKTAVFVCQRCGARIKVEQDEDVLKEPLECYEEQGGCGRTSTFKLYPSLSTFIDSQKIEIQESPEGLRGGAQPERITAYLEDDLVGDIAPGDRVVINGLLVAQQRKRGGQRLTSFDKVIKTISIEKLEQAFEEVEISEEDEKKIIEASKLPDIYERIRDSIAPTIYGLETEKEAIVLQLFGGIPKVMPDGTRIRGDIHVLLVGDPGTAKSQLLSYVSKLAPRSIYASGKATSAAGLTAAAVRDEFGEGHWTLEAGALVLADMGVACIDEIDKMSDQDRSALHQAMEQQEISVAKAGINATLKSRCAILAAANPKLGRFDEFIPIHEQINMPPALLSRFDLIFSLIDKPDKERDSRLARHILLAHRAGEVREQRRRIKDSKYTEEDEKKMVEFITPYFDPEFLRKYIAYARRKVFPVLQEDAIKRLEEYYVSLRSSSEESIPFTPRQLEAFARLAEASARVRLSDKVTVEDAERAIAIIEKYLRRVGLDRETGRFDIDVIATGISRSQHDRMLTIIEIIKRLSKESPDGSASMEDILNEAEIEGIDPSKAREAIERLRKNGQIYEPRHGRFRLTEEY